MKLDITINGKELDRDETMMIAAAVAALKRSLETPDLLNLEVQKQACEKYMPIIDKLLKLWNES